MKNTRVTPEPPVDRVGFLFGEKLAQSMSPYFHSVVYRELGLNWEQIRYESANIDEFLSRMRMQHVYGASVTMPNKVAILPHLDDLTDECRDVGACNTVYIRESNGRRQLVGANTDVVGVRESFYQNVRNPDTVFHGRPALVIGGGGAARSAVYALHKWMRVTDIYLVNRDEAEVAAVMEECTARGFGRALRHVRSVEEAETLSAPGAIVACVPDFAPVTEGEKLARDIITVMLSKERKGAMLEMCYNPTPYTKLGAIAEKAGWQVILGTEALIWQGIAQDEYWTQKEIPSATVKVVQGAIADKLSRGLNPSINRQGQGTEELSESRQELLVTKMAIPLTSLLQPTTAT